MNNARANQPSSFYRWTVLVIISVAMFGNYYVYDSIAPIADLLKEGLSLSDEQYGLLYTVYSIAAVIVLLLGGIIIDRIGTARSTLLFGAICTVSGIMMAVTDQFSMMLAARFLLGVGAEPLIVAITTALAKWFKGKELSFAFGINLTIARLGSVAADNSPSWAATYFSDWQGPLEVAAVISLFCVIGAVGYWALEHFASRRYSLGEAGEMDRLVFSDLFRFDRTFWYIVALCVTFYAAVFPFRAFAPKFFIEAHGVTREFAGALQSVLPTAALIATPLFGLLVDRLGKRALFMMGGAFLMMPVYLLMAYTTLPLWVPIGMLGLAFSLIPAVMWPSVAYIVSQHRLGTAYAVMTLVQQIGVAGMTWLIGRTNDLSGAGAANPEGYIPGMWIFSVLGISAVLFAFLLRRAETGPGAHGLETITTKTSAPASEP